MKTATKPSGSRKKTAAKQKTTKTASRASASSKAPAKTTGAAGGTAKSATGRSSSKSKPTAREHSTVPEKAVSRVTFDHDEIRRWAEERGGQPACVSGTGGKGDIGMIRIDFPGFSGEGSLEPIEWDDWFEKFDERNLALLYQEQTAGGQKSNFNKIVSRETAEEATKPKVKRAGGR